MSAGDNSYYRLLFAIRERNRYDSVFERTLDELSGNVDLNSVESCVAIGTGFGEHEFLFARMFLPNLQTFVAVEPDHESVKALRAGIQGGKLPGVEATAMETSLQHWSGVDKPVDIVLLFDFLMHVERADRQALFQRLFTQCLTPNGIVIIITDCYGATCGFMRLLERLGKPAKVYYDEAEKEMLDAGFNVVYTHDIKGPDDFSNPSEDLVKFFQLITDNVASEQEVRAAVADIFGPNQQQSNFHKKLGIFKK